MATITNEQALDLSITGMTCGSCVRHVTSALVELEGVSGAQVNLQAGRARVSYDPSAATPEQMLAAVEEAGYHASLMAAAAPGGMPTRSGCGCSSCS